MNRRITLPFRYALLAVGIAIGCVIAGRVLDARANPRGPHAGDPMVADPAPEDSTDPMGRPAELVYKNITTFRGISARELMGTMSFMSASLGVRCGFCHVQGDFASDDKPAKNTARGMVHMTDDINNKNFGPRTVTCFSCHRGNPEPQAAPALGTTAPGTIAWAKVDAEMQEHGERDSAATPAGVLNQYIEALGGKAALARVRSRTMKITETPEGAAPVAVEIVQKAPNMVRVAVSGSDKDHGSVVRAFDGRAAWMLMANRPPGAPENAELEGLLRQAEMFPALDLQTSFTLGTSVGRAVVDSKTYRMLTATRGKATDRLYFNVATGLLEMRVVEFNTVLGILPFAISYSDYRVVDGVKVPHLISWSTTRGSWADAVTEIHQNVTVDDAQFARPK